MRARGGAAACILACAGMLVPRLAEAHGGASALLPGPDLVVWIAGLVSVALVALEAGLVIRTQHAARGTAPSAAMRGLSDNASDTVLASRIDHHGANVPGASHAPPFAPIAPGSQDVVEVTGLLTRVARRKSRARLSQPAGSHKLYAFASDTALERALEILIDNALANGPQAVVSYDHGTSAIAIHVDDDGPGVPHTARPRIFDWRYYMTTPAAQQIGCGVELVIAQHIVRAHSGSLAISASPIGGARFTMRLPLIGQHELEIGAGS
ncbi:MAG: sensor histidine kinase [Hyphomicrobium sp.]|uniref:sensor histidine kinase n=1 Tax=Hyphomicrobium sp. TaxID=82 RepID=UPI003D0C9C76